MEPLFIFYHLQAPQSVRTCNIIISVHMIQEMNYILINHKGVVHVLLMTKCLVLALNVNLQNIAI